MARLLLTAQADYCKGCRHAGIDLVLVRGAQALNSEPNQHHVFILYITFQQTPKDLKM